MKGLVILQLSLCEGENTKSTKHTIKSVKVMKRFKIPIAEQAFVLGTLGTSINLTRVILNPKTKARNFVVRASGTMECIHKKEQARIRSFFESFTSHKV